MGQRLAKQIAVIIVIAVTLIIVVSLAACSGKLTGSNSVQSNVTACDYSRFISGKLAEADVTGAEISQMQSYAGDASDTTVSKAVSYYADVIEDVMSNTADASELPKAASDVVTACQPYTG
jgi:uncharacterized lipoprotein YehR (DUF1307 family)